jgi:membrane-associated phospholipid phosphatase
LYQEFKDYNIPLAFSGYLFSSATAALRVTNNRHWVPDVLAGAGLAIFITNLVYFLEPLKKWDPFKSDKKVNIVPDIDTDNEIYRVGIRVDL